MAATSGQDPWEALRALPMGQRVELSDGRGRTWLGTVVPRHELSGDRVLPLKLESGYNIGVRIEPGFRFRLPEPRAPERSVPEGVGPSVAGPRAASARTCPRRIGPSLPRGSSRRSRREPRGS